MASNIIVVAIGVGTFVGMFALLQETNAYATARKQSTFPLFWFASLVIVIAIIAAFYFSLPDLIAEFMVKDASKPMRAHTEEFLIQLGLWNLGLYGLCVLAGMVWGVFVAARGLFRAALRAWFREVNAAKADVSRDTPDK